MQPDELAEAVADRVVEKMRGTEPLLTVRGLADHLSISERRAAQLIADGEVESVMIGGCRRISPAAVDSYLAGRGRAA